MRLKVSQSSDCRPRREQTWTGIVIHHTGIPTQEPKDAGAWARFAESMTAWLSKKDENYVSAHYQINRDGSIVQLVDPASHEAYHAGVSSYWHPERREVVQDWNRHAIGIELLGDGNRITYSEEQYQALSELCKQLMARFRTIHPLAIVGHEQLAPGRKADPGAAFDWRKFFRLLYA